MSDESRRNRENITGNPEHVEGEIRKATKPTAVTPPPTSDTIVTPPVSGPEPALPNRRVQSKKLRCHSKKANDATSGDPRLRSIYEYWTRA